jgi:hypothetical protein
MVLWNLVLLAGLCDFICGEDGEPAKEPALSFSTETSLVTKFVFRGQRLTDGWSLQPSGTVNVRDFSFGVWGSVDLQAVNEGDTLFLPLNPDAPGSRRNQGLQGRFSEVDLVLSYSRPLAGSTIEAGAIAYILPYARVSAPATTEVFAGFRLDSVPLKPSVALYVDVDESRAGGETGLYLQLEAERSFPISSKRVGSVDVSASLGIVNSGFGNYCYELEESGIHDMSLTASLPVQWGRGWSSKVFVSFSALLGEFREHQYVNLPDWYAGRPCHPSSYADTLWGGISLALE